MNELACNTVKLESVILKLSVTSTSMMLLDGKSDKKFELLISNSVTVNFLKACGSIRLIVESLMSILKKLSPVTAND